MLSFATWHWLAPQARSLWWGVPLWKKCQVAMWWNMPTKKYMYQMISQGLMLHKPTSSRGWVSLVIWVSLYVADYQAASLASVGLSAGIHAIWSDGLRHLNHRSLSHIVDKSRWRQAKLSGDTCYLAGWAEGDKPGSAHSYPHRSSAQCDPSWSRAGWKGC